MTKKPLIHEIGVQLSDQANARTYNERDEGLLYNKNDEEIRVQIEGADRQVITNDQTQSLSNKTLLSPTLNSPSINVPVVSGGTFDNIEVNSASINSPIVSDGILTNSILNNVSLNSPSLNSASASGGVFDNITTNSAVMNSPEVYNGTFDSPMLNSPSINSPSITGGGLSNIVLTNSTIDVDNNTVSNIELDNLKSGVLLTTTVSVSINDASIFSAKAIKDYVDQQDSSVSGNISAHIADTFDAHMATAIGVSPYLNLSSTDVQAALQELQVDVDTRLLASEKGAISGVCPLGADQKVSATYLPSYVDDVLEYANLAAFPVTGETGKIYVALDTNLTYRWSGSAYVEISQSLALGETSVTAYRGDRGATAYTHSQATTGIHGLTGGPAGTSDTQVLTNKDIDGGTASDSLRVTLPKNTLSNLQGLTRKEGTIVYATDTDKVYYDDGTNLTAVGAGGVGNVSTYALLKSDDDTGTWATGKNATFLGGGSIQGTFTKQSNSSPLNGTYSYLYTQAAGSLNDYFCSDTNVVPLRSRNSATSATNLCRLKYTYNGSANDIKLVVYDATNSTILASTLIRANADYNTKFEILFEMPYTCTSIKFGGHVLVANNGKVLKFDDIEFSDDPFQSVKTNEQQTLELQSHAGFGSSATRIPYFSTVRKDTQNTLFTYVNNSTNGLAITFLTAAHIKVTYISCQVGNNSYGISINGSTTTDVTSLAESNVLGRANNLVSNEIGSVTVEAFVSAGDVIRPHTMGVIGASTTQNRFTINATAISSNIIQTWTDGTEWTSYIPTFNGMTPTGVAVWWKREGSDILLRGKFTTASVAASEFRMSLPNGLLTSSLLNTVDSIGVVHQGVTGNSYVDVTLLASPNQSYIKMGVQTAGNAGRDPKNGSAMWNDGVPLSFWARVSIQGWSSTPTLLALPVSKQNSYNARITNTGTPVVTSTDADFISSITDNGNGDVTVNFKAGLFTVTPKVNVTLEPTTIGNTINGIHACAASTSSVRIYTYTASAGSSPADHSFSISVDKQGADYTPPGVFVGNVQPDWQYDLTVTGTNWTTTRAVGVVYKMASGQYRLKFNIVGSTPSGTRSSYSATISGVTAKNVANFHQVVSAYTNSATAYNVGGTIDANSGILSCGHASATTSTYGFSGDIELDSKPTWATNTP